MVFMFDKICFYLVFFSINLVVSQKKTEIIERDILLFSQHLNTNSDSAFIYIQAANKKSFEIKNDSLISRTLYNIGYYHYLRKHVVQSKVFLKQSLKYAYRSKYHKISALCLNQLGTIHFDNNNFEEALKLYLKSLRIAENHNLLENKSRVLLNLGNLFLVQKDTLKSEQYYDECIANSKQNNLYNELIKGYMNKAVLFAKKNDKKAVEYYNYALEIAEKEGNLYTQFDLHINLSELYLDLTDSKNSNYLSKELLHLKKAKIIQMKLNDPSLLFYLNFNFGGFYRKNNNIELALIYYNKSLKQFGNNITSDQILNLYKTLSETYEISGNNQKALEFKNKQLQLSEKIFTIKKNKAFNEIQTKYEVEKKKLKIDLLSKEKLFERNKKRLMLYISVGLLMSLFMVFLFFKQRIKTQKLILEKEHLIHEQEKERLKQEHELKWVKGLIEGQDKERNRVAREIHDGIGGALAGIKLELSQFNSEFKSEKINLIVDKMAKAFADLRLISHDLSFNYLKGKNLENLFFELKKEYEDRNEFQIEMVVYPTDCLIDIKETVKHQIYRVVQELLNNVSKHANAQKVFLNFTKHSDFLNIMVEDDGCGFENNHKKGIGLNNIIERLSAIGAIFELESAVGKGTVVTIDIPISQL